MDSSRHVANPSASPAALSPRVGLRRRRSSDSLGSWELLRPGHIASSSSSESERAQQRARPATLPSGALVSDGALSSNAVVSAVEPSCAKQGPAGALSGAPPHAEVSAPTRSAAAPLFSFGRAAVPHSSDGDTVASQAAPVRMCGASATFAAHIIAQTPRWRPRVMGDLQSRSRGSRAQDGVQPVGAICPRFEHFGGFPNIPDHSSFCAPLSRQAIGAWGRREALPDVQATQASTHASATPQAKPTQQQVPCTQPAHAPTVHAEEAPVAQPPDSSARGVARVLVELHSWSRDVARSRHRLVSAATSLVQHRIAIAAFDAGGAPPPATLDAWLPQVLVELRDVAADILAEPHRDDDFVFAARRRPRSPGAGGSVWQQEVDRAQRRLRQAMAHLMRECVARHAFACACADMPGVAPGFVEATQRPREAVAPALDEVVQAANRAAAHARDRLLAACVVRGEM